MAAGYPRPVVVWLVQLEQDANRQMLDLAVRERRPLTVTLTYDENGKSKPPRITVG